MKNVSGNLFLNGWDINSITNGAGLYNAQILHLFQKVIKDVNLVTTREVGSPSEFVFTARNQGRIHQLFRYMTSALPWSAVKTEPNNKGVKSLQNLGQNAKYIIVNHIAQCWGLYLFNRNRNTTRLIYIAHNDELSIKKSQIGSSPLLLKFPHIIDYLKVWALEGAMIKRADLIVTLTSQDARQLARRGARKTVVIPPVLHDTQIAGQSNAAIADRGEAPFVVIVSSFYWTVKRTNLDQFLRTSYSKLRDGGLGVRIVGRMPDSFRNGLLLRYPGIDVRSNVATVSEHLSGAVAGLLIDELGGGFKLSGLTYLFNDIPIYGLEKAISDELTAIAKLYPDIDSMTLALNQGAIENEGPRDEAKVEQIKDFYRDVAGRLSKLSDAISAL